MEIDTDSSGTTGFAYIDWIWGSVQCDTTCVCVFVLVCVCTNANQNILHMVRAELFCIHSWTENPSSQVPSGKIFFKNRTGILNQLWFSTVFFCILYECCYTWLCYSETLAELATAPGGVHVRSENKLSTHRKFWRKQGCFSQLENELGNRQRREKNRTVFVFLNPRLPWHMISQFVLVLAVMG